MDSVDVGIIEVNHKLFLFAESVYKPENKIVMIYKLRLHWRMKKYARFIQHSGNTDTRVFMSLPDKSYFNQKDERVVIRFSMYGFDQFFHPRKIPLIPGKLSRTDPQKFHMRLVDRRPRERRTYGHMQLITIDNDAASLLDGNQGPHGAHGPTGPTGPTVNYNQRPEIPRTHINDNFYPFTYIGFMNHIAGNREWNQWMLTLE